MPAIAPDIAVLRNEVIRQLRTMDPPMSLHDIGLELGMTRQNVCQIVAVYNLDGRGSNKALSESEGRILAAARKWGVTPPVPIHRDGIEE